MSGESSFYDELLIASDNLKDISFSRYGTITEVNNNLLTVQETDSDLIHMIPTPTDIIVNNGDKVLIGFADNDLHKPYIAKNVSSENYALITMINSLGLGLFNIDSNGDLYVELPNGTENYFYIDANGDLYVTLPNGVQNDYSINEQGDLLYDRWDF